METAGMRQQERRAKTTTTLRAAACQLFAEFGYEGASLDAVALRAGLSKGAIYVHFPTKQDLFRAVAIDALDDARDRTRLLLSVRPLPIDPVMAPENYFSPGADDKLHVGMLCELWRGAWVDLPMRTPVDPFRAWRSTVLAEARGADWALAVARLIDGEMAERRLRLCADSLRGVSVASTAG